MKISISVLILIITINFSYAQVSKLLEFENRILKKVEVGMSGEELKKKIGKPKAVEGGFPDTEERIIVDLPEQKGQLNYSTWFYFFEVLTITVPRSPDDKYFINNVEVFEDMYNDYKDLSEIYLVDGSIIYPAGRNDYQRMDSAKFSIQPKNMKETRYEKGRVVNEKKKFLPILCVLFDRGTQVVASTKFMFKIFL
jgi:hypothetical protein